MRAIKSVADELTVVSSPLNNGELVVKVMSELGPGYKEINAAIQARDTPISSEELFDELAGQEIFLKDEEAKTESTTRIMVIVFKATIIQSIGIHKAITFSSRQ